jgi:hypothetical protein
VAAVRGPGHALYPRADKRAGDVIGISLRVSLSDTSESMNLT